MSQDPSAIARGAYRPRPSVSARRVGEEMVLLDADSGLYYGLNAVGARVWELLGNGRTLEEAAAAIAREYEVSPEDCRRDVGDVVRDLLAQGLLAEPEAGP